MYEKDMRHVRVGKLAVSMTFHGMCVKFSKIKNKLKKIKCPFKKMYNFAMSNKVHFKTKTRRSKLFLIEGLIK